jgi:hypothetical protein
MHAGGEKADHGKRLRLLHRIGGPQAEALAQEGQDRRVLGERRAVVELERRHAAERMDLHVLGGLLLALGEVHALRLVLLAALLEHDVGCHGTGAGGVEKRQHRMLLVMCAVGQRF